MRLRVRIAALVMALATSAAVAARVDAQSQDTKPFTERVDVNRVLFDVRVTDGTGQPIEALAASDFSVRIDGKPARVESATWVTGALRSEGLAALPTAEPTEPTTSTKPPIEGRLIVFLIQKDLEPSRITGLMQLLLEARSFFAGFTPRDRLAVLSFDSRLRIWSDFTNDLDRIRTLLQHDILMSEPAALTQSEAPSLVERLSARDAKNAASMEEALVLIGRALEPLPGAKSVIVFGHGFGRLGTSGVDLAPDYDEARKYLRAARTSVFCLDVTRADYHSLEVGLQQVAEDTGGFYERTHLFPGRALTRLAGTLAGHYVLIVERPPMKKGAHHVVVSVSRKGATVLVRDFVD